MSNGLNKMLESNSQRKNKVSYAYFIINSEDYQKIEQLCFDNKAICTDFAKKFQLDGVILLKVIIADLKVVSTLNTLPTIPLRSDIHWLLQDNLDFDEKIYSIFNTARNVASNYQFDFLSNHLRELSSSDGVYWQT